MSKYILPTFTGIKFDLQNPTIDMICIEDIAHHLSLENRFNGATKFPISVGYHSINMCKVAPDELKLLALLHDAEEAYYKDLTSPYKALLRDSLSSPISHSPYGMETTNLFNHTSYLTRRLVAEKFKFVDDAIISYQIIKNLDLRMAITERNQLCATPPENWKPELENHEPFLINIMELSWRNVEENFLELYNKYRRD